MAKPDYMDEQEWQARCQLAALYRLIAYYKMTDLIDTHISLRLPHEPAHFLINRYGVTFEKMKASDLVKIDHDGKIVERFDEGKMVNVAGFVIHSALHHARADINCVIHSRSRPLRPAPSEVSTRVVASSSASQRLA